MGRKPLATAVKEKRGTFKKDPQRRNHDEPQVVFEAPKRPTSFKGRKIAQAKWKHACQLLGEMNVLSTADKDLLEAYCLNYEHIQTCEELLHDEGLVVEGARHGDMVRNPRFIVLAKLRDQQLKMLAELGLTPSARTRLKANPDVKGDPFTEFIRMQTESIN